MLSRSHSLAVLAIAALALGACQEKLTGGNACPSLCTEQTVGFVDTVFTADQVIDTMLTLPGLPLIGTEPGILLARYAQNGDSVVSVGVFRFDSINRSFLPADTASPPVPLTSADSSFLSLTVTGALDTINVQDTVVFTAYNVYANVPYLDTGVVHAKFLGTPIGTVSVPRDSVTGILKIPIDTLLVTQAILTNTPVNIGISVSSKKRVNLTVLASEGTPNGNGEAVLNYRGIADTLKEGFRVFLNTQVTTFGPPISAMRDYQMSFQGSPPYPVGVLAVGGLPSNRVLVRFKFPSWLIDSTTTVVRADLILNQQPFPAFRVDSDSVTMNGWPVTASPAVTDLVKIGTIIGTSSLVSLRQAFLPPYGTGVDTVSLIREGVGTIPAFLTMFSYWKFQGDQTQRAIVLALASEGTEPRELWFYGTSASPALRPKVHVSYVPHSVIGLP